MFKKTIKELLKYQENIKFYFNLLCENFITIDGVFCIVFCLICSNQHIQLFLFELFIEMIIENEYKIFLNSEYNHFNKSFFFDILKLSNEIHLFSGKYSNEKYSAKILKFYIFFLHNISIF